MQQAKGTFEVVMTAEPPYDQSDGVTLARASFRKTFTGPLEATSTVQMLSARAPNDSAAYVAIERIVGVLDGRKGSFVVVHKGFGSRTGMSLSIDIVPESGTGALVGLTGTMHIDIVDGQHFYTVEYGLG